MQATATPTHSSWHLAGRTGLGNLGRCPFAGVCIVVAATLSGCSDPVEPESTVQLLGQVEEVTVASSIQADQPLDVGLRGTLGGTNCFVLDRIDVAEAPLAKELRVMVEDLTTEDGGCGGIVATFDTVVALAAPHAPTFELRIIQRVGPPIVRQIEVVM